MGYATGLMEYSDDPLSDATPTYTDRSSYVLGDVTWADGKSRDLDEPQAGSIQFRLSNANGEWVPNSSASLYPDSPFLLRRWRLSVNGVAQGVWYVSDWQITYPAGTAYSEVVVTAVDGHELLSLDALDLLDPPTATTYEEVVMADVPFGYWKLNDPVGTTKVEPVTGPEGTYGLGGGKAAKPTLGEAGLIVGDPSTSARFLIQDWAKVPIKDENFTAADGLTVEIWADFITPGSPGFVYGPLNTAAGDFIFTLRYDGSDLAFAVLIDGTVTPVEANIGDPVSGRPWHIVGTFDGQTVSVYGNGVQTHNAGDNPNVTAIGDLETGDANSPLVIGNLEVAGTDNWLMGHVAVYEHALSADRVMAHYLAGSARGFNRELAGERIANVADSPLWAETEIQAGEHMVHPIMEHGQSKLDELRAAVKAEMPETHFFFDGDGNPVYRAWNYNDGTGVLATFGPGGISYQGLEPVYDSEMFNEVTVGHESAPGEETQHTVTDSLSTIGYRRAHSETGLILSEHHDAIAVAAAILEKFKDPRQRFASLTLNGAQPAARTQILDRRIGDLIRVKGIGVNDADIVTTILGRTKTLTAAGHLTCTWTLGRGFDAAAGTWRLGISGFTELGETTVLG